MPIIEVDHVTKEFQLGELESFKTTLRNRWRRLRGQPVEHRPLFKALDDISFSVEPGEVLGIIGHNGAGKSTLLKLLAGISKPSGGRITTHGRIAPLIEVGAGFVGQLTGRENVYLNGAILGMSKREIDRKFDEIVDFSELEEFIDTPVKRYSSGMRVKLAFSVATSIDSEILIIDEVLAVGDLAFQRKCFDRIENLIRARGNTVLLVSHNIRQVERLCQRVIFLDHGSIRENGSAREVCKSFYQYIDERVVDYAARRVTRLGQMTTGEVELMDLSIISESDGKTHQTDYLSTVRVRVKFAVRKPLISPIFVIGLHTVDFVKIATSTSKNRFRDDIIECGEHELTVAIVRCPLAPGAYAFRFSIDVEDPVRNIFYGDGLGHFTVRGGDMSRTDPELEGFFLLETKWDAVENIGVRTNEQQMPITLQNI